MEELRPVMGIDPGIRQPGYGVIGYRRDNTTVVYDKGVIKTSPSMPLAERLNDIYSALESVILKHSPEAVVVEKIFFAHNHQSILKLAHARGVILLTAARCGVPVFEYSPQEIKKAVVGTGSATKEQVQYMVRMLLGLRSLPKPADMADALAMAICHLHCKGRNP